MLITPTEEPVFSKHPRPVLVWSPIKQPTLVSPVSIEFPEWRFNLRGSNTEPVIRLNVETRGDEALMKAKTAELLALIRS